MRKYTNEEKQFIIKYKNRSNKWLSEQLNRSISSIDHFKGRNNIKQEIPSYQKFFIFLITKNGCFENISHRRDGFGYVDILRNNKNQKLHRYIYEYNFGKIPEGKVLLHSCDNPACININHLTIGTQDDNVKDMINKNRHAKGSKLSKLNKKDIFNIRNDSRENGEIAKDYNVNTSTICRIKNKIRWGWL